jgi:hypothetical protein
MCLPMKQHLTALLTALDASPGALRRPVCRGWIGDWQITGKHGHALADGAGYLLYVQATPRRWTNIKRHLAFAHLTQDGDDEGCFHLDRLPTKAEAESIRDCLVIRRRRNLTADARARLAAAMARINRPLSA